MTSSSDTAAHDPLAALVEKFLAQKRGDATLTVEQFCSAHPEHAAELRELLATVVALEDHKRDRASSGTGRQRASVPQLERLGEFKIVGEIGRGGMGVVFEAVQESLGRKVALKVLPQSSLLTGNQLERFRREAQIAAQLHHSNIVPVFGSGESDGYHWYAMQFIVGMSLDRWRDEQTAAPPQGSGAWRSRARFVARLGVQAASALHYAHGLGTLHRDIKPGNLLLETSDHLWVTDFGLAKALEAEGLTHSGDLLGTLQYMAPEQFAGSYDARSEVYALGVTLYELLTLRAAFAGSSRSELMERIRTQRPESLRKLCPEAPEDLVVVIEKAMAREPRDRYADAGAFASDLQAFLEDRPIEARRLSAARVVLRWCRRNRGMAALAASTLLAFVGAGVTGWIAYSTTNDALVKTRQAEAEASAQAENAARQSDRAEKNLNKALALSGRVFDALVGPDPALAFDEDEDTGEQTVVVRSTIDPRDVALLQEMLTFYDQFAAQNANSEVLQLEAARACRRVGAIRVRLGKPDDLARAAADYERALSRLGNCKGDVARETAAVLVEYAQLERRLGKMPEADARLQRAQQVLATAADANSRAVRFDRARVHFLLGQRPERGPGGPGGPGGPSGPGGPGGQGRREDRLHGREELQKALELVDGLLREDADNAECRALKARCLLTLSRGGRPDAGGDREAAVTAAIGILRELVAKHPEEDSYRFELADALLAGRRREEGPRPRPAAGNVDLSALREAMRHAQALLDGQPQFVEYQALCGRAHQALGLGLRDSAGVRPAGESGAEPTAEQLAERTATLRLAETELLAALQLQLVLVHGDAAADRRFLAQLFETRRALVGVYAQLRQRAEQLVQLGGLLDLVEQQAVTRRFFADPRQLEELVRRSNDEALQRRLASLRERLPAPREAGLPDPNRRGR